MRILIITHYFPPEIGAPQARLSDLARLWTEAGHDVHVITGMPNHPTGIVPPEYRRRLRIRESVNGYSTTRTWLYATPNEGFIRKTIGHLSFMVSSVILGFRDAGRPDVVVVSSPTFFSIGSAWVVARLKRARFVVEVRDLWPAIFVELGVLTNRWIIAVLEKLELAAYRSADAVVTVSEGFTANIIDRGIDAAKVHTVTNGVDVDAFDPNAPSDSSVRAELGATQGDCLVLYIGAHGISQGVSTIVEAATKVCDNRVRIALVGEGADREHVLDTIERLAPPNVVALPGVSRDRVAALLAAADVCLVPLRDIPLFTTFIPSKIFELLAAGRPIIGSVAGEPADILRRAGATVVSPENADELAAAIDDLAGDVTRRAEIGARGRSFVEANYNRRALATKYLSVLEGVVR